MEHLNQTRETTSLVALPPTGIINNPSSNSIDPSKPPADIRTEAEAIGEACVEAALSTAVDLNLGQSPYSELRTRRMEGQAAQAAQDAANASVAQGVADLATSSLDPGTRRMAQSARGTIPGHPELDAQVLHHKSIIAGVDAVSNPTPTQKQNRANAQKALKRIKKEYEQAGKVSSIVRFAGGKRGGGFRDSRAQQTAHSARRTMEQNLGMYSTLRTAGAVGTKGISAKGDEKTSEKERERPENQVSTKGAVFVDKNGRKFVVIDTEQQAVQAFRPVNTDKRPPTSTKVDLDKSAEVDPVYSEPILEDVYYNTAPPGQPKNLEVMPRGALQPDGSAFQGLPHIKGSYDGNMYYSDGTLIESDGQVEIDLPFTGQLPLGAEKAQQYTDPITWAPRIKYRAPILSPGSFLPGEDRVIVKPLLTPAEAIQAFVGGGANNPEFDASLLEQQNIALSTLADRLIRGEIEIIRSERQRRKTEKERRKILEEHLVFEATKYFTPAELLPPHDRTIPSGHFARYTHRDDVGETERAARWDHYISYIARVRHRALVSGRTEKSKTQVRGTRA
jgi:hypothetical protein